MYRAAESVERHDRLRERRARAAVAVPGRIASDGSQQAPGSTPVRRDLHGQPIAHELGIVALEEAERIAHAGEPDGRGDEPRVLRRRVGADGPHRPEFPRPGAELRVVRSLLQVPLVHSVAPDRDAVPVLGASLEVLADPRANPNRHQKAVGEDLVERRADPDRHHGGPRVGCEGDVRGEHGAGIGFSARQRSVVERVGVEDEVGFRRSQEHAERVGWRATQVRDRAA